MNTADRNQLVESHLRFAAIITNKACRCRDAHWQDCYQAACMALIYAADAYDPERGVKFITFAWPRLVGAVRAVRNDGARHQALPLEKGEGVVGGGSPEELLIEAEGRAAGTARLAKLGEKDRERVEAVLDGDTIHAGISAPALALRAGVRVGVKAVPARAPLTHKERDVRWFASLTQDEVDARNARRRDRRAARAQEAA